MGDCLSVNQEAVRRLWLRALVVSSSAFEFICKFLYLFFPRDIHNSCGIVEKAFAQKA